MLSSLYIKNIAVIKEASVDFKTGFTALTGETGAGKSIIIDSISAILGGRVSKDLIRTSCESAKIVALFSDIDKTVKEKLCEMDLESDADDLQISREIKSTGKSTCKINGVPVTATMLKELGVNLISIQGQHDSYELLSPEVHGKYLDNYAQVNALITQYQEKYNRLKEIKVLIDNLSVEESQKERRLDFLKYQIEEIEEAEIQLGEKESLSEKLKLIRDSENIAKAIALSKETIAGNSETEGLISLVDVGAENLEDVSESMPALGELAVRLRNIEYELQDISQELRGYEEDIEFSPHELNEIEERLDLLYRLSLKYGESEEEIIAVLESAKEELQNIEFADEKINLLSEEFEEVKAVAINLAKEISRQRKIAAIEFSQKVKKELSFLNMPNVEFSVELERVTLNALGCDKISFMVSANAGEALKPMAKVASGGELSRIMLAIKTVLSKGDSIATMIFDEIDAGISGEAANKVGKKLKEASADRQIICITHLAQIAAMANGHLYIEKNIVDNETQTKVTSLSQDERVFEIARIISGDGISELKLKMAKEMLS